MEGGEGGEGGCACMHVLHTPIMVRRVDGHEARKKRIPHHESGFIVVLPGRAARTKKHRRHENAVAECRIRREVRRLPGQERRRWR